MSSATESVQDAASTDAAQSASVKDRTVIPLEVHCAVFKNKDVRQKWFSSKWNWFHGNEKSEGGPPQWWIERFGSGHDERMRNFPTYLRDVCYEARNINNLNEGRHPRRRNGQRTDPEESGEGAQENAQTDGAAAPCCTSETGCAGCE